MHRDSLGAEDVDSYGYIQGGKDWYMPQDIVGDEAVTAAGTTKVVRTATCLVTA